jgi:hypothetical protein
VERPLRLEAHAGSGKRIGGNTDTAPGVDPTLLHALRQYELHYNMPPDLRGRDSRHPQPPTLLRATVDAAKSTRHKIAGQHLRCLDIAGDVLGRNRPQSGVVFSIHEKHG